MPATYDKSCSHSTSPHLALVPSADDCHQLTHFSNALQCRSPFQPASHIGKVAMCTSAVWAETQGEVRTWGTNEWWKCTLEDLGRPHGQLYSKHYTQKG
ncbi:hypothetical protein MJO29_015494 [Puccinia striiformis f. sp. tritici]|nr:hypothetical protein MJO29_015494 [Puccinia striiformis f. sp. tritici]